MIIDHGQLLGKGKQATVYLNQGKAYKVFNPGYPREWIAYEFRIHEQIRQNTRLRMPVYRQVIDHQMIEMTYVKGIELTDRMRKLKYQQGLEDLIDIQSSIYEYRNLAIPNAHLVFREQIEISTHPDRLNALAALENIKKDDRLCHFDCHFSNVMLTDDGYVILDWANAKNGNIALDMARTYVILKQYAFRMANKYLRMILKRHQVGQDEINQAIKVMAFLRIQENDSQPFHQVLMEMVQKGQVIP